MARAPWWTLRGAEPRGLEPDERRYHALGTILYPIAVAVHLGLLALFALLRVPELALFNVLSVAAWAGGGVLHARGRIATGYVLAWSELVAHAWFATWILSWDSGFHHYLLAAGSSALFLPRRTLLKVAILVASTGAYLALSIVARGTSRSSPLSGPVLEAFNVVNIAVLFAVLAVMASYYAAVAARLEKNLELEFERSESLLRNILPREVARRLKAGEVTIADSFGEASVLFCDICGFTELSARLDPKELVGMLNRIFTRIDELVERYGLEKVKTIGDAYMVAAGIPEPRADHAAAIAEFALELLASIEELEPARRGALAVRIGIHSGPVVAGVIGKRKFAYDMWGDTVNTAARMESHGVRGAIHVSEATRELLRDRYVFDERGEIEVKGKGVMRTWLLRGRPAQPASPQSS